MMRALVERHRGLLPLDTVEGIWRIIISTFTYMQAPYSVHVDVSRGDAAMRDSARFHFGFTVPCVPHLGAVDVIAAVADVDRRSRHVRARRRTARRRLVDAARRRTRRRRSSPDCRSSSGRTIPPACRCSSFRGRSPTAAARDVVLEAVGLDRWRAGLSARACERSGRRSSASAADQTWASACWSAGRATSMAEAIAATLRAAGAADVRSVEIGAHAARFDASALRPIDA